MLSNAGRHGGEGFDFCDTTHCQLYQGDHPEMNPTFSRALRATASTRGEVLTFDGRAIEGFYTAVCGGLSLTPQMVWGGAGSTKYPYARNACRWCREARYHRWERSADVMKVLMALSDAAGIKFSAAAIIETDTVRPGDLVQAVRIHDQQEQVSMTVDEFRRAIGRRLGWNTVLSPTFSIERRGGVFIFRGRGFGSQVGLCLAGAVAQARAGRPYQEILRFYYREAERASSELSPAGNKLARNPRI
jgi:stage II sporulation protein D